MLNDQTSYREVKTALWQLRLVGLVSPECPRQITSVKSMRDNA